MDLELFDFYIVDASYCERDNCPYILYCEELGQIAILPPCCDNVFDRENILGVMVYANDVVTSYKYRGSNVCKPAWK